MHSFLFSKIKACVDLGRKAGCFICNFSNFVADFGNRCKINYIASNFEPLKKKKKELTRVRLFKFQLLNTLQSSFLL